jgi:cystathionine beta-lyase/cystathionine gamma-synthase
MERHCKNAAAIAEFLEKHNKVKRVVYPGLPSHPQHELARRQMSDFGGMLSFELRGSTEQCRRLLKQTKILLLAESLGGVESLIEHPASMTHSSMPPAERERAGISDELIRVSVGIEDQDDLIGDLSQALATV